MYYRDMQLETKNKLKPLNLILYYSQDSLILRNEMI